MQEQVVIHAGHGEVKGRLALLKSGDETRTKPPFDRFLNQVATIEAGVLEGESEGAGI